MKAILNVSPSAKLSRFNGLTFNVETLGQATAILDIHGYFVELTYNEFLICDLDNEITKTYIRAQVAGNSTDLNKLNNLTAYILEKGIHIALLTELKKIKETYSK